MIQDPQVFYIIINLLVVVIVGLVGWLLRRAIAGNDEKIGEVLKKVDATTAAVGTLQVLIAGDYVPRTEHAEFAKHVEGSLMQVRGHIHDLRDVAQAAASKVATLEAILKVQPVK